MLVNKQELQEQATQHLKSAMNFSRRFEGSGWEGPRD